MRRFIVRLFCAVMIAVSFGARATAAEATLVSGPTVATVGGETVIAFAVSAPTDVEVAVLDADGKIVRHLAAGVIGADAPVPFQKNSLEQRVIWDGKDDLGQPVAVTAGMKVRVGLGLKARLHRIIGWSGQNLDAPQGIACAPDGTLYVAFGANLTAHAFSTVVCAYDRDGRYLRQVIPASPALPPERRRGWPRMQVEGMGEIPIVQHVLSRSTYPAFSLNWSCFPAAAPDGSFLVLNKANSKVKHSDIGSGRMLLKVGPDGSVAEDYMARKIAEANHEGDGHVAVSPDGKVAYVTGLAVKGKGGCNVIWKTPLDRVGEPEIFAGRLFQKPEHEADLGGPQGLDTDREGNVYVADRSRGRIAIFSPDGNFLKAIPLEGVFLVQVSAKTGAIYATVVEKKGNRNETHTTRIVKFGGLRDPEVKASLATPDRYTSGVGRLALDDSGESVHLWYCGFVWQDYRLYRIADEGAVLKVLDRPMERLGGRDPKQSVGFSDQVSVVGGKVLGGHPGFGTRRADAFYRAFDAETGKPVGPYRPKFKPGRNARYYDLVYGDTRGGSDGLFYVWKGKEIRRFDEKGVLVPYGEDGQEALGKGIKFGHPHTRGSGFFVTRHGEVYANSMPIYREDPKQPHKWTYPGNFVVKFLADGTGVSEPLIQSPAARFAGIVVDTRGNIYVGAQVIKKDENRVPEPILKAFPAELDKQTRDMYEQSGSLLKFPPTGGEVVADPEGDYRAGYQWFGKQASVSNVLWTRRGGLVPTKQDLGCYCETSRLDIDPFDRLFVPDPLTFSVQVLDTAGNEITRFGSFGNMDCRGPGSPVPEPEIALGWPTQVDCALGRVYISDLVNRRIVSVRFEHAVSGESEL